MKITESYWNFGKHQLELKRYWLEKAVLPSHGDNPKNTWRLNQIRKLVRCMLSLE